MKKLDLFYDGDTYPVIRPTFITLTSGGVSSARDLTDAAVEFQVRASDGTLIVTRPGRILSAKANGKVECFLAGRETDFDGAGGELHIVPVIWVPMLDGAAATNLLVNGGLDTFTGAADSNIATGWSLIGSQSDEKLNGASTGLKPASIFDKYQEVEVGPATTVTYLQQVYSGTYAAGAYISMGGWVRATILGVTPAAASDDAAIGFVCDNSADNKWARLPLPECDWTFVRCERHLANATTALTARIRYLGQPSATFRFDELCLFAGRYAKLACETMRVTVAPRIKPAKAMDILAGFGGFEADSDADGIPDAWVASHAGSTASGEYTSNGIKYKAEADPANVHSGLRSLKVSGTSSGAGSALSVTRRGAFNSGETWRFSVWIKSGAVTTPGEIQLEARPYQTTGIAQQVSTPTAMPGGSVAWTEYHTDLALTADVDQLECRLWLEDAVGVTYYVDDAKLYRIAP